MPLPMAATVRPSLQFPLPSSELLAGPSQSLIFQIRMWERRGGIFKHVPFAGPWAVSLTCHDLFRPHSQPVEGVWLVPFYRWGNEGFELISDVPQSQFEMVLLFAGFSHYSAPAEAATSTRHHLRKPLGLCLCHHQILDSECCISKIRGGRR